MISQLAEVPGILLRRNLPLSELTRFGLGGPADWVIDASSEAAFIQAWHAAQSSGLPWTVLGGGSNLVVNDSGLRGIVLRYTARTLAADGNNVHAETGANLQDLVDLTIEHGLAGMHTMTGIPGWVGGAVYGNAGAYGHSIQEFVTRVRFFDGTSVREFDNADCEFRYRESVFKRHKNWVLLSASLVLPGGDAAELKETATGIRQIRDEKYPPTMQCAGSIFKNLILKNLPERARAAVPEKVVREGKVPSAWFLEQVGAKGIHRGGIKVADYHANLIYNEGGGTAAEVCSIIDELKDRVCREFGLELEEEVQYVGFADRVSH
jgi:UDP-N-acetylmuramate dehydrogenase